MKEIYKSDLDTFSESLDDNIVITKAIDGNEYIIHFDEDIINPSKYRIISNTIRNATKKDILRFVLNSPGGNIFSAIQIINLLLKTEAHSIAEIYNASSACSALALSCNEIEVGIFAQMMIHSISTGNECKLHELESHINYSKILNKKFIEYFYATFLTATEINDVIQGKDIWLSEIDISKRLEHWVPLKYRNIIEENLTTKGNRKKPKK